MLKLFISSLAIGLYDESAQTFNLNPYSLSFLEKKVERQYEMDLKESSIKFSKISLLALLVIFVSYVITKIVNNVYSDYIYVEISLLLLGCVCFIFMRSHKYKKHHYNVISIILGFSVFSKIMFDWIFSDYNKSLSGILVPLLSSMSIYLNINFLYVLCYNVIFFISYSLRFLFFL